ncbi:tetratricopeptide repeat protein [Plebeiibacterium marinum]|uniref:Tetratricopeptide repeat protein n=1 Tax=Plebeiibacterium marinum TaxID=2992111 RepID=A0AAE3SK37_9BACT|nr:tetratricopeptide repeat protein [Plebeiobacterium marinum]MCW3805015.1 tetratricopeptide repeat protein [Plebeiobacterium marinum]
MKKQLTVTLLILLLFNISFGQDKTYKKQITKANHYINIENYAKAAEIYDELLKEYPTDSFVLFKAGECFLFSEGRIKQAVEILEKVVKQYPIENKNSIEAIESRFYLGQAYHLDYQFEKALKTYELLNNQIPAKKKDAIKKIEREVGYCTSAIELMKNPVQFKISNLGPLVNTEFDEHSPIINLTEDLLIFTSNRETEESLKMASGISDENVYFSLWREGRWITTRALDINTKGNNASIGISPDGKTLLFYQNDGAIGNIYTSTLKNDKWGELEKLPAPINSMANETHASFSLDGNTIFFSSDRIGGFGGKDLYKSTKLPNGEWGKVVNLGSGINTELDEESPYIHPNGKTLYFSSESHNSMGGFDIFSASTDSSGVWDNVTNIGYPINTPFDDLFFAPTVNEQRVYYASKRNDSFGGSDLYLLEFPDNAPNALTVVGGFIFNQDGDPAADAHISIINKKTGNKEGVYRPSQSNGKYIVIIPADTDYLMEIKMKGYKTILKDFNIPSGNAFARKGHTFYLDPILLEKDQ